MASWYESIPSPTDSNGIVVPLDTKELVYRGEVCEVYGFVYSTRHRCWGVVCGDDDSISLDAFTMPDSWEKLEEDAVKAPREYVEGRGINAEPGGRVATMTSDILRRVKALSGLREGRKDVPKAMVSQPMAGETDELCLWDGDGDERVVLTIWELRDIALRYALYGGQTFEAKRCEDTACGEGREASCDRCALRALPQVVAQVEACHRQATGTDA